MAEPSQTPKSSSWWQTLPGILTATTGMITALAGLIVALNQTGWLKKTSPVVQPSLTSTEKSITSTPSITNAAGLPRQLSVGQEVKLAEASYKLLSAELAQHNTEKLSLTLHVRMTNLGRYPANFWDASFRLLVDDIPLAPANTLNEVVAGTSAVEGELVFVFPKTAQKTVLRILTGNDFTDINLALF